MEDSEIQKLCRVIHRKHRKALDVLFEERPDRASDVRDVLVQLIELKALGIMAAVAISATLRARALRPPTGPWIRGAPNRPRPACGPRCAP